MTVKAQSIDLELALARFELVVGMIELCATAPRFRRQHQARGDIGCYVCPARWSCVGVFDSYLVSLEFLAECRLSLLRRLMGDLKRCKRGRAELEDGWTWYLAGYRQRKVARVARAAAVVVVAEGGRRRRAGARPR